MANIGHHTDIGIGGGSSPWCSRGRVDPVPVELVLEPPVEQVHQQRIHRRRISRNPPGTGPWPPYPAR